MAGLWPVHRTGRPPAAERGIAGIYARLFRPRPGFVWVDSPWQALPGLTGLSTLDDLYQWVTGRRPPGDPPLASDLVAALSVLRDALDGCVAAPDPNPPPPKSKSRKEKGYKPWPVLPPLEALEAGVPLREVLRQGIREALRTSLADGSTIPFAPARRTRTPAGWRTAARPPRSPASASGSTPRATPGTRRTRRPASW